MANLMPRRRIAIVEDDEDLRLLMILWLSPFYDCAGFPCGESLMAALNRLDPCLLVLDVGLPGIDGFELARALRAGRNRRAIPVLFLTGLPASETEQRLRQGQGDGYLGKPFEFRLLQESVEKILARS
jgi:DNA-binding response OmpR family regulator